MQLQISESLPSMADNSVDTTTQVVSANNNNRSKSANNNYGIIDTLESRWIFIDQSNVWKAGVSWSIFLVFSFFVPVVSHLAFRCPRCDHHHRRPYDWIVQSSLSMLSAVSFLSLSSFSRKYGLRRFLFIDKMSCVTDEVRRGYSHQLHRAMKFFCAFMIPCFIGNATYKIWWFISGAHQIPHISEDYLYLSHTLGCLLLLGSWLYRTSLFFLVCMLFKLTCSMQILRLEDFAQVFQNQGDVGLILMEHLAIRRTLRIISHRFRGFVLSTLILVTVSQFASLLVTTQTGSSIGVSTAGELALCSATLVSGLFICLRNAAKITHKAQSVTSLAAKWHTCATVESFYDMGPIEETNITSDIDNYHFKTRIGSDSDTEEGDDDKLDNTKLVPVYRHTVSYQKRQALVTYLENNKAGITVYGFMLDRTYLHTIFALEMSLTLWLLNKTIGFS